MYFVIKAVQIASDGRVSCAITSFNDLNAAKVKFHDDLSKDIGNAQYSYTMEEILDANGLVIMRESWYAETGEDD